MCVKLKWKKFVLPDLEFGIFPQDAAVDTSNIAVMAIPYIISLAFVPYLNIVSVLLVIEKEKKTKDIMMMMGLEQITYLISWMITECLISIVSCVCITILIIKLDVLLIDPFLLYTLIQVYVLSIIAFGFILSLIFNKSKVNVLN